MRHPVRRPLSVLLAAVLVGVLGSCSMDEAELVEPGVEQVVAGPGQLRVLTYDDRPVDHWIDVVAPDPAVFEEGQEFREDDSRAAEADEAAQRRRLLTAVAPGRTLLLELNCPRCERGAPSSATDVADLHVWDLVVGDPDQPFSDGTGIARAGRPSELAPGDVLVVARPGDERPVEPAIDGGDATPVRLLASHEPADGADLHVDVFVAVEPGEVTIGYGSGDDATTYRATVR